MKSLLYVISIVAGLMMLSCAHSAKSNEPTDSARDTVRLVRVVPPKTMIVSSIVDKGRLRAGSDTALFFSMQNIDTFAISIDHIEATLPYCRPAISRDSVIAGMEVALGIELTVPQEKGPFSCGLNVYTKGVTKPSYFEINGEIE